MSKAYNEMSYVDVAAIYNDINDIPPDAAGELGRSVAAVVGEGATVMDFGGGAGRISVPIAAHTRLIALDIEHHMLMAARRLAERRGVAMKLAAGTVLRTPFAQDTFDAVVTTNVLHQIEFWRDALLEAGRVLKPGGVLVIGRDVLDETSCAGVIRAESRRITGEIAPEMRPTDAAGPALFQFVAQQGWEMQPPLRACAWIERVSPATILQRMADRTHNETWSLDEERIRQLMARLTPWVERQFADLETEREVHWEFMLYPVRGPGT